ncbi:MAG: hypothetical protein R3C61_21320 [Bacteroidia bacterium]
MCGLTGVEDIMGWETHSVELDYDIFENVTKPDPSRKGFVYPVGNSDFRLKKVRCH